MGYLLFWARTAARRFVSLFKTSPVVVIGAAVFAAAFLAARNDIAVVLDTQRLAVALSFFVLVSLLLSLKNYRLMPLLIRYSKGALRNSSIRVLFFARRALVNNIPLILFDLAAAKGIVKSDCLKILPAATVCSLFLSVLIMLFRNEAAMRRVRKEQAKAPRISPVIKGVIADYFSSEFLQTALVSIVLFVIVIVEFIGRGFVLNTGDLPVLFTGMLVVMSFGFMGIVEAVPRINWRFHGIVAPREYGYHIGRSFVFLGAFFLLPALFYVFMLASGGILFLLKYLYCLAVLLLSSVFISFTTGRLIHKAIMLIAVVVFTAWAGASRNAFLPVLLMPAFVAFLKARNEYREWYYQ